MTFSHRTADIGDLPDCTDNCNSTVYKYCIQLFLEIPAIGAKPS
jgi:hypothetical protein